MCGSKKMLKTYNDKQDKKVRVITFNEVWEVPVARRYCKDCHCTFRFNLCTTSTPDADAEDLAEANEDSDDERA